MARRWRRPSWATSTRTVSLLGLVDDIIGLSEAGYKAAQMNELINLKTAEKSASNLAFLSVNLCLLGRSTNNFFC